MPYPNRLIPQPHFKIITVNNSLNEHYLIRFTPNKDLIDPVTRKLNNKSVAFQTDHLRDLSTNLLGISLVDDIYWGITDCQNKQYFNSAWEEFEAVNSPIEPEECKLFETRGYFFLKIGDFNRSNIRYSDPDKIVVCLVLHTPTKANFWHFSLRWECNGLDTITSTEKLRRPILAAARAYIIENAKLEIPSLKEIDQSIYMYV